MDDPLRPKTVPLSAETILWFEFLLDPTLLTEHLAKINASEYLVKLKWILHLHSRWSMFVTLFVFVTRSNSHWAHIEISLHRSRESNEFHWHHNTGHWVRAQQKWGFENWPKAAGAENTWIEGGIAHEMEFTIAGEEFNVAKTGSAAERFVHGDVWENCHTATVASAWMHIGTGRIQTSIQFCIDAVSPMGAAGSSAQRDTAQDF